MDQSPKDTNNYNIDMMDPDNIYSICNEDDIDLTTVNTERMWIEAIAEEPKSAHLRTQLANYYFQSSRLKEASYSYEIAIQLDPNNIIAHYDYAFMKHHQFYFALAQFEYVIPIPSYLVVWNIYNLFIFYMFLCVYACVCLLLLLLFDSIRTRAILT